MRRPSALSYSSLNGGRLIEICEHVIIVLQLVNSSEFDAMALELYGDPHLLTWIEAAHVTTAATDPTCRIG